MFLSVRSVFEILCICDSSRNGGTLCGISLYRCHWASEGTAQNLAAPWKLQLTLRLNREAVLLDGFVVHLQTLSLYPTAKSCFLCGSAVHLLWCWPSVPLCKAFEGNVIFSCVRAEVWLDHQAQEHRTGLFVCVSVCVSVCLFVLRDSTDSTSIHNLLSCQL